MLRAPQGEGRAAAPAGQFLRARLMEALFSWDLTVRAGRRLGMGGRGRRTGRRSSRASWSRAAPRSPGQGIAARAAPAPLLSELTRF